MINYDKKMNISNLKLSFVFEKVAKISLNTLDCSIFDLSKQMVHKKATAAVREDSKREKERKVYRTEILVTKSCENFLTTLCLHLRVREENVWRQVK